MSVVEYRYSIVFGIRSKFIYDTSSRSQVFLKIGVLKNWSSGLQLYWN